MIPSLFLSILFFSLSLSAQSLGNFEGCPENSLCSKETGALYKRWTSLLKAPSRRGLRSFVQEEGLPVGMWSIGKNHEERGVILWDSPCDNHRGKIYEAKIFTHNLKSSSAGDIFKGVLGLLIREEETMSYTLPRGNLPLFIEEDKLFFTSEEEGHYYAIGLESSGVVTLEDNRMPDHLPTSVPCPDISGSLSNPRCRHLWDRTKKTFVLLAYESDCP